MQSPACRQSDLAFRGLRSTPVGSVKHPQDVYRPNSLRSASVGAGQDVMEMYASIHSTTF